MVNAIESTTTTTTSTTANERGFIGAAYKDEAERPLNGAFSVRSASDAL
jgi:hypothetical protein